MTLRDLYETSIEIGRELDPRGQAAIERQLQRRRDEYAALPAWQQALYDQERFRNPYGDVRISNGPPETPIRTALVGINLHVQEMLLGVQLAAKGTPIDAFISHHTNSVGISASLVADFMEINADYLMWEGVPEDEARACIFDFMAARLQEHEDMHRIGPDTAKLLGYPLACIHTPVDYAHRQYINALFARERPETVGDVVELMLTLPEMQEAARIGAVPRIMTGDPAQLTGRMHAKFAGGYAYPPSAFPLLAKAGVQTVVQVSAGSETVAACREHGIALVRLPHYATDNIGQNLLLDELMRRLEPFDVIPCNYFGRVDRAGQLAQMLAEGPIIRSLRH
ncbi:MAG: hypothetical protein OXE05_03795 [Chloroflexi bacterium]|nr:hypothetical protein [Chloroflexota bacterium]